jgi:transposase
MIRLNNSDWERIRHHFPEENISERRPGRKPVPSRKILEATLWILNTGAQWHHHPPADGFIDRIPGGEETVDVRPAHAEFEGDVD